MNETIKKFGYSDTLIKEYDHWCILLRAKQVTLGSLILIEKSDATSFAEIDVKSFAELKRATTEIEATLTHLFGAEKFNYLMLMMADPNVHYHVLPRYSQDKPFHGMVFKDMLWPVPPNLKEVNEVADDVLTALCDTLRREWRHTA